MRDYTALDLQAADRVMLDYAMKLTRSPGEMVEADVLDLRAVGYGDEEIHHIAQIAALFNYYNRVVDGLGADHEHDW